MRSRNHRPFRHVAALSLVALVAVACGGNDPNASKPTDPAVSTGDTTAATEAPVLTNAPTTTDAEVKPTAGGSLVVGIDADASGYNPTADPWASGGHNVARTIFDPLATYDASGKVVPYLAKSISANADATVWTITLRDGVMFHDGTPCDAAAVKANFDANKNSPQYGAQLSLLSTTTVVDATTLELAMSQPWSTFPNVLTGDVGSQIGYIAAPAMLASPDGGRNPIGTGPFKFKEWVPDDHLTVVRNDAYWQTPAYLDEVTFKPIPDSTARKAAFDAGDIDLYYTGSSSEITEYQAKADEFSVTIGAPGEPDMIMFNTTKAPLDDVRVRRAIVMATDMSRVFDYLDATGVKQITHGPYADTSFWYTASDYPEYDPAGAKKLIDEYVAEKGTPVEFDYAGNQIPFIVSLQELYQSMWAEAGMKANIVSRAQGDNINAAIAGDFQVMMWGGIGGGDPDSDYNDFHSETGLNFSGFHTPAMDAALDKGRALTDPAARKEQYAIVQKELGANVPFLWAGSNQYGVITRPAVQGVANFLLPDGSPGQSITASEFFLKDVWLKP
jgi:ABC-type transport system substrate-binding protein